MSGVTTNSSPVILTPYTCTPEPGTRCLAPSRPPDPALVRIQEGIKSALDRGDEKALAQLAQSVRGAELVQFQQALMSHTIVCAEPGPRNSRAPKWLHGVAVFMPVLVPASSASLVNAVGPEPVIQALRACQLELQGWCNRPGQLGMVPILYGYDVLSGFTPFQFRRWLRSVALLKWPDLEGAPIAYATALPESAPRLAFLLCWVRSSSRDGVLPNFDGTADLKLMASISGILGAATQDRASEDPFCCLPEGADCAVLNGLKRWIGQLHAMFVVQYWDAWPERYDRLVLQLQLADQPRPSTMYLRYDLIGPYGVGSLLNWLTGQGIKRGAQGQVHVLH